MRRFVLLLIIIAVLLTAAGCQEQEIVDPAAEIQNISNLQVAATAEGISVTWEKAAGADCYYVYRVMEDKVEYHYWGIADEPSIVDETITDGVAYRYRVYPALRTNSRYYRSALYLESALQRIVRPPKSITATPTDTGILIDWLGYSGVYYYAVHRLDPLNGERELLGVTPYSAFMDDQAGAGSGQYTVTSLAASSFEIYKDDRLITEPFYTFIPLVVGGSRPDGMYSPDVLRGFDPNCELYQTDTGLVYIEGGIRYERIDNDIYESEPSVIK